MTKDKDIQQLFDTFQPQSGRADFVQQLNKKMQVVDIVRGEYDGATRFYRGLTIFCFLVGMAMGLGLLSLVLLHPIDWAHMPTMIWGLQLSPQFILFCARHADTILSLLAAFIIILGATPLMFSTSGLNLSELRFTQPAKA